MDIKEYISNFTNHPVLFVGTGISLRYLKNSFTWDSLLEKISYIVYQNEEVYLDIKARCTKIGGGFDYPRIASILENAFDDKLKKERHGEFSFINDSYYQHIKEGNPISRFKLFLAHLFSDLTIKNSKKEELDLLKQLSNNISSIITTNYDRLLETISNFNPLVSNDILLTNPYGSLYKIHGCILKPEKIVITAEDYEKSKYQNELIKAQLLSLFIHNPIIFLGYGIQDENVNGILKTVFNYVGDNQEMIKRIRNNFLLVEYEEDSENTIVSDYDLKIDGVTIQIKKLKTDNYSSLYKALIEAKYPISAMDVKKVQSIMYDIVKKTTTKADNNLKEIVADKENIFIIDTNVFVKCPTIISKVGKYKVVIPTTVLEELDRLKLKQSIDNKALNDAVKNINKAFLNNYSSMEEGDSSLLPNGFDAQKADCLILSVALRYKTEDKNPILLTSDNLLQSKALGLGITTISLKDFLSERR